MAHNAAKVRRYLTRTTLKDKDPASLWKFDLQLNEVEQAFNLKTAKPWGVVESGGT